VVLPFPPAGTVRFRAPVSPSETVYRTSAPGCPCDLGSPFARFRSLRLPPIPERRGLCSFFSPAICFGPFPFFGKALTTPFLEVRVVSSETAPRKDVCFFSGSLFQLRVPLFPDSPFFVVRVIGFPHCRGLGGLVPSCFPLGSVKKPLETPY